jgi:hypothetical protein
MKWQYVAIQTVLTFVALIIAVKFFGPDEQLSHKIDRLEKKIKEITAAEVAPAATASDYRYLQVLRSIDSRLAKIEAQRSSTETVEGGESAKQVQQTDPPLPQYGGRTAWMADLSDEQRDRVSVILREHFAGVIESLPKPSSGNLPDPAEARETLERSNEQLKDKMREVLNQEQYEKFLESLPSTNGPPPSVPPSFE